MGIGSNSKTNKLGRDSKQVGTFGVAWECREVLVGVMLR